MHEIASTQHQQQAQLLRRALSIYEQHRDLISLGAYVRGSDPRVDAAVALWPQIQQFLQQDMRERVDLGASLGSLGALTAEPAAASDARQAGKG